jgi:histidinol dehydrogenase
MNVFQYPERKNWDSLCKRAELEKNDLDIKIREVLNRVKLEKDAGLKYFSSKFDGYSGDLKVSSDEIERSVSLVPEKLKKAIPVAMANIEKFHKAQLIAEPVTETMSGVKCWRKSVPIDRVGLYVPGGSAPLFSTLLMLAIPAKIAGCSEIVVCTPPGKDGEISPVILYTARLTGCTNIFKVGGAQAIAAMAYGTETIPKVYKIFGPGNQYVTKAKELIQEEGVSIDMPAGPSEVLVIGDRTAEPEFVASDLLSQAEHGADSQAIFVTDDKDLVLKVQKEVEKQVVLLPRKEIALKALGNSRIILLTSIEECIEFSNLYAPEHLIINTIDPYSAAEKVTAAGSVFLGKYSSESAGDYATGTNHTLPTNGYARNFSGVSTESFMKKITFQEVTAKGIAGLGKYIETMAEAESLDGHKNAVSIRLKSLKNV